MIFVADIHLHAMVQRIYDEVGYAGNKCSPLNSKFIVYSTCIARIELLPAIPHTLKETKQHRHRGKIT
jgi:hypothetical protein